MSEHKIRKYLDYPMVIDWLQWSDEFKEELGKPDMPQITLTLIAEMKAENTKLEEKLRVTDQDCKHHYDKWKRYELANDELRKQNTKLQAALYVAVEALGRLEAGYGGMFGNQSISPEEEAYDIAPEIIKNALSKIEELLK